MTLADDWPLLLPLLPAAYYLAVPLLALRLRLVARPIVNPLDLDSVDSTVRAFLVGRADILGECGFGEACYLHLPDAAPGADTYAVLLVNRPAGEVAVAHLRIARGPVPARVSCTEVFSVYPGGARFSTHTSDELPPAPPAPGQVITQVPNVRGESELARLHRAIVAKHRPEGDPEVYPPGGEADYLTEKVYGQLYARLAACGWLRLTRGGAAYRPTIHGAYRIAWGQTPPMRGIRRRALHRREAKVLAEFRRAGRLISSPHHPHPEAGRDGPR